MVALEASANSPNMQSGSTLASRTRSPPTVITIPGASRHISRRSASNSPAHLSAYVVRDKATDAHSSVRVAMKRAGRILGLSLQGHANNIVDVEFLRSSMPDERVFVLGSCDEDGVVYLWFLHVVRDALGIDVGLRLLRKYSFYSLRKSCSAFYSRIRLAGTPEQGTMVLVPNDGSNVRIVNFHCEPTADNSEAPLPLIAPPPAPAPKAIEAPPPPQSDDDDDEAEQVSDLHTTDDDDDDYPEHAEPSDPSLPAPVIIPPTTGEHEAARSVPAPEDPRDPPLAAAGVAAAGVGAAAFVMDSGSDYSTASDADTDADEDAAAPPRISEDAQLMARVDRLDHHAEHAHVHPTDDDAYDAEEFVDAVTAPAPPPDAAHDMMQQVEHHAAQASLEAQHHHVLDDDVPLASGSPYEHVGAVGLPVVDDDDDDDFGQNAELADDEVDYSDGGHAEEFSEEQAERDDYSEEEIDVDSDGVEELDDSSELEESDDYSDDELGHGHVVGFSEAS